jgi:hypothetical protein
MRFTTSFTSLFRFSRNSQRFSVSNFHLIRARNAESAGINSFVLWSTLLRCFIFNKPASLWRHFVKSFYTQFQENLKNPLVSDGVSHGSTQSLASYTAFIISSLETPNNTGHWPDSFPIAYFCVRLNSAPIDCWQSSSNEAAFSPVAVTSQPPLLAVV